MNRTQIRNIRKGYRDMLAGKLTLYQLMESYLSTYDEDVTVMIGIHKEHTLDDFIEEMKNDIYETYNGIDFYQYNTGMTDQEIEDDLIYMEQLKSNQDINNN